MTFHLLVFLLMPQSAVAPKQDAAPTVAARACPEGWESTEPGAKKKRPKNTKDVSENKTAACIELAVPQLEIQEYLQSYFRSQEWKIAEEHLTEDSWTFSRELNKDELLSATDKNTSAARVKWTGGVALVHISTVQVADGFARAVIRARFRGYGQNADQFAQQREYWELESNGSLESSISSALKAHFKAAN